MSRAIAVARTPTSREMRAPNTRRLRRSRPRVSVPSQLSRLGGVGGETERGATCAYGSYPIEAGRGGASKGQTTNTPTRKDPETKERRERGFPGGDRAGERPEAPHGR